MHLQHLLLPLLLSLASASPLRRDAAPTFAFGGDAPFTVAAASLAASLTCPNGNPSGSSPPVLLVHGTSTTGAETWGQGYVPALAANGFAACYLTLPGRAMGDMQISAEYVAYGLHYISALAGGVPTAVISHSQGGPLTQWALQFWPSVRTVTSSFIALSPDFAGIKLGDSDLAAICIGDLCQASLWQQSAGSNFLSALHDHGFQAQVPTTSIWTQSDGVVSPPEDNASLPSATVVSVQDLCPLRLVQHVFMPIDAAAFAFALDALQHSGAASLSRVQSQIFSVCFRIAAKNMQINVATQIQSSLDDAIDGFILGSPRVSQEPALMAYA
ncbi:hypothetical protein LTR62_006881 [Meristemomyces frigidus]|uniref:Uncharacterized protein n=1 Tax=Meristemomyces frigidus TaxID=1508187 RepID=A0AAN7TC81_9PEZI|nr:hypothetical protein LTR62_006881 [Meristemomyces frigidus]